MQGDMVKALRIVAEKKGWDPTKVDGTSLEVGVTTGPIDRGDRSLSPFPGPAGDAATYDNPVMHGGMDWSVPGEMTNSERRTKNADPTPSMPGA